MKLWKKVMVGGFVSVLISGGVASVVAQQNQPGSGLSVSPTRTELSIDKGKTNEVKISVKNVTGNDVIAKVEINDFEADNETGEPKILVNTNKRTANSIKPFLAKVTDLDLKKDEAKVVSIPIQIPTDAAPGAYYGVVRYSAIPTDQKQNANPGKVSLTASVGSLVLVEVPGNITQQIQVKSVRAYRDAKFGTFFFKQPTEAGVQIKNNGNSFSKPFGRVTLTNSWTKKEIYSYELNNTSPRGNILPGSTRIFKDPIKNIKTPGRYSIVAGVSYGSSGEVITGKVSFWYIPMWLAILIGVLIIAIAVGIYLLVRRIRKPARTRV